MTLNEARKLFAAKFKPIAWIYWTDFLLSAGLSWFSLWGAVHSTIFSLSYFAATIVGFFAMLRAVLFIHELAHLKAGALPFFEFAYNACFGVPFLAPSLLYTGSHGDHHRQNLFGTKNDPEYAPIAQWSHLRIALFIVTVVLAPMLLAIRFAILGPLSWCLPPLRRLVVGRASALVINEGYERPYPRGKDRQSFIAQEVFAAIWIWSLVALIASNLISSVWIIQWSVVAAGTLVINQIRTLAAHRYINDGHKLTVEEQLLDSINLDGGSLLTVLAAPVGLRFHALHHFLPNVPYHALPALHKTLLKELPRASAYRETSRPGILRAVFGLLVREPLDNVQGIHGAIEADTDIEGSEDNGIG